MQGKSFGEGVAVVKALHPSPASAKDLRRVRGIVMGQSGHFVSHKLHNWPKDSARKIGSACAIGGICGLVRFGVKYQPTVSY